MFNLEINQEAFLSYKFKNYKYKKNYFDNKYTLYFYGHFRTPINEINEIIIKFTNKKFDKKNIEKIFKKINGICTLVIQCEDEIKVCASIYHPHLKIFHSNKKIIVTEEEFYNVKKLSAENSFLKLFSHHSYFFHEGISSNVVDFISPGSYVAFNKNNLFDHKFSWYLDFEKFCSRDDHNKIALELAEHYSNVFENLDNKKKYFFGLSGGLDSAVAMSAALKKIDLQPFHIARGIYSDELGVAKGVSKFFNKKLNVIYNYDKKFTALDFSDNIKENLEFNYNFIKKDSVFYPLFNSTSKKNFPNCHVFTGTGDPLLLTINHFMVYSDRIRKNFGYSDYKDQRYFYSIKFFQELKDKNLNDNFSFFKDFPNINSYYYPLLSSFVEQMSKQFNFREKYLAGNNKVDASKASPISDLNHEQRNLINELKKKRAIIIIKRVLKSDFFEKNLQYPNARTAQILLKFFHFLGQYGKENHQTCRLHDDRNLIEFTAMNSSIALSHLSVIIDDQLVNYCKWHLFKVFEHLNGIKYEDIYYRPSLKNLRFVFQRFHSKIRSKIKKLPEFNDNYALINNKSLEDFVKKNKIIEKFNDFKASHENKNLFYNYPDKSERMNINKLGSNFWKINNIINIVNKLE